MNFFPRDTENTTYFTTKKAHIISLNPRNSLLLIIISSHIVKLELKSSSLPKNALQQHRTIPGLQQVWMQR